MPCRGCCPRLECSSLLFKPASPSDLIGFLQSLPEGRKRRGVRYPQWLVLLMAILEILSGCRSAKDLERFARRHREAFNTAFGLEFGGAPTDSTFLYLLERVNVQSLFAMLREWMLAQIAEQDRELDQLICDVKTLRGSANQPELTLPSIYELQRRWRPTWKPASRRRMEMWLSLPRPSVTSHALME